MDPLCPPGQPTLGVDACFFAPHFIIYIHQAKLSAEMCFRRTGHTINSQDKQFCCFSHFYDKLNLPLTTEVYLTHGGLEG